jgi:hypothetical protein
MGILTRKKSLKKRILWGLFTAAVSSTVSYLIGKAIRGKSKK